MSDPILCFERVTYSYPGARAAALRDVTLELRAGEFCVLAGLSGGGKSTLLRAACGLVPHFHGGHFAGRVVVAGLDTRQHGPARVGAFAGALFQDPETQLVSASVRAELSLALESRGAGAVAVARGVEEVALALGIDALLDRPTQELSGGEQQRVALAAALAGRPRVVLLDEPTSQLDPVAGDELIGLLRRLNQEWETTVLLCEHRLERCLAAADRVIALDRGRVACDGDPRAFLRWAAQSAPALQTPGARLFSLAGLPEPPVSVKEARTSLRTRGLLPETDGASADGASADGGSADGGSADGGSVNAIDVLRARARNDGRSRLGRLRRARGGQQRSLALSMRGVWHELRSGRAVLRGIDLEIAAGESVALMGRNGAGKSTLLRHAAGLLEPTRGRIERGGRVALLLQNPGDYLIHERVSEEAPAHVLRAAGLESLSARHPRDLSGGERQRLALAIVGGSEAPALLALDEPTRGMDREAKAALAAELRGRALAGYAVIVATHDPEFAAACARRAILLADGRVIADGAASELLAGGWYFATETARILGGAGGAVLPEEGAELLAAQTLARVGAEAPERTAEVAR
ncbi:MAG TPA: ATP-binding cassette domain-containing protein [Solirubrobacteraceae bacterium]|nr:ATP-binding cassette domain-containing protein [Solirubrobacteraceae bacterium]